GPRVRAAARGDEIGGHRLTHSPPGADRVGCSAPSPSAVARRVGSALRADPPPHGRRARGRVLISTGYLPGAPEPSCPAFARIAKLGPPWTTAGTSAGALAAPAARSAHDGASRRRSRGRRRSSRTPRAGGGREGGPVGAPRRRT